ncbi:MAG: DUF3231 family protein [bacterium]
MFLKTKSKTHKMQSQLSTEEAHRLWIKTQSRYILITNIHLFSNFAHDIDFKYKLEQIREVYQNHANLLEKQLNKYSLKSPEPNKTDIEVTVASEVITDREIARTIYSLMQLAVGKCMKTLHNATYNDDIRELFIKITIEEIDEFFKFINYIKAKDWLANPPLYPNTKSNEIVAANEIWELWNHLKFRYLNIQQTKIYSSFASDIDFQLLLNTGINILEKQATEIENMLMSYGVNLPEKYPKNIPTPESKQQYDDKFIYMSILTAMQNAVTLHGFALQELVINEKLQRFFRNLMIEEMDLISNLLKYGKIKGWAPLGPLYRG